MGNMCSSSKPTGKISSVKLAQDELEQLHELTNISENEILTYHRQFLKASSDGRMTHSQFDKQLQLIGASTNGSRAIFEMIDKDNSGVISFREYLLSALLFSQQSLPEQQLGAVFDTYLALARQQSRKSLENLYKQGLNRDDLQRMLKRIYTQTSEQELQTLCDEYLTFDQNRNGYISKQEFIAACMKNRKLMEQLGLKDAVIIEERHEDDG